MEWSLTLLLFPDLGEQWKGGLLLFVAITILLNNQTAKFYAFMGNVKLHNYCWFIIYCSLRYLSETTISYVYNRTMKIWIQSHNKIQLNETMNIINLLITFRMKWTSVSIALIVFIFGSNMNSYKYLANNVNDAKEW